MTSCLLLRRMKLFQKGSTLKGKSLLQREQILFFNPVALGKAKIVCNFGLSECNRINN